METVQIGSKDDPDDETIILIYPNGTKEKIFSIGTVTYDLNCQFGSIYIDEMELETVQCFLPTGMVYDVTVHPEDEICTIKEIVISQAIVDGNF